MKISVPDDLLPKATYERNQFLKRYFCELIATEEKVGDSCWITLAWPDDPAFYIDPNILRGLEWWSDNYGKVNVSGIPFAVHRGQGIQLSLDDSWTIYSWSKWLSKTLASGAKPASLTMLHLDDHDDMMTPRIVVDQAGWRDSISRLEFDLWSPETVEMAIQSGAIGIGSFIAPLLHEFPSVHIRHLCSTEYTKNRQGQHIVRPILLDDDLLDSGFLRPALQVSRGTESSDAVSQEAGHHLYQVTDDLISWLDDLPDGPILLHIDMDYFNNRFNGDSAWVENGPKYDPSLPDVLCRIDQVFEALDKSGVAGRIVDVAVALSPGFFPVDLWAPAIEKIQKHVGSLVGSNVFLPSDVDCLR